MEELEFVCDKVVEKKTRKKDASGKTLNGYSTTVKCKSQDLNEAGKPMHKMSIDTDHPIEPGDEITLTFTSKQTKLSNLVDEIHATPHAEEIVKAQLSMLKENDKNKLVQERASVPIAKGANKKRSHHKKKED